MIDRGESGGRQYIVLEYVEGENLKQLVARDGPLPVRRALELAIQTGRALAFAHASGLVHRDVKPQNVLLGNGTAKVTDFGIARSVDVHGLTQTGTVLGTSDYIAPEQATGQRAGERSDVYSLGVVLFELLTGEVPFRGENFVEVALRHVNEPAPSVLERRPEVPLRVAAAIARSMEKDPADRFASMSELVGELGACLAELGDADNDPTLIVRPRTAPAPRRRRQQPQPRRRAGRRVVVAVALVLAAAAEPRRRLPSSRRHGSELEQRPGWWGLPLCTSEPSRHTIPRPATDASTTSSSRSRPTATRRRPGRRSATEARTSAA